MPKQGNMKQYLQKVLWSLLYCLSTARYGALKYVLCSGWYSLEKIYFFFLSSCELWIASGLGMSACIYSPSSVMVLHLVWTCVGTVHAAKYLWVYMCVICVSGRHCFLLLGSSMSPEGMDLIKTYHLGLMLLGLSFRSSSSFGLCIIYPLQQG